MAVASLPNSASAETMTNQSWHTKLQERFGRLGETSTYDPNVNYERIYRLFESKKFEYKRPFPMYAEPFNLIKDAALSVLDQNMGLREKLFNVVIFLPPVAICSIPLSLLTCPVDIADFLEHQLTNSNAFCQCSSCEKAEKLEILQIFSHENQRTIDTLRAYHRVFPLRKDYWTPSSPPT